MNCAPDIRGAGFLSLLTILLAACGTVPTDRRPSDGPDVSSSKDTPIAITNVTIVDVVRGGHRPGMTVMTRDHQVVAVGADIPVPPEALQLDGAGKFLVPGLWDMHSHHEMTGVESLDLFLANGVVGTRDMGSDPDFILPLRDRIKRGEVSGPEIVAAGPILDSLRPPGPLPATTPATTRYFALMRRRVTNASEGRDAVRDLKIRGVDFVKVHDNTPREAFFAIAAEASSQGLPLAGHVPHQVTVEEAVDAGIRSIEHLANFRVFRDCSASPPHTNVPCEERYNKLASRAVWQTPTLAFMQAVPHLFSGQPLPHDEYASDGLLVSTRGNAEFSNFDEPALAALRSDNDAALAAVRALVVSGSGVLAACDGLVPGFCLHDELEWMTKAGLSPLQALQTATINPARFLGRENIQGAVAGGSRADLVLLDADPLADIRNTRRIAAVVVRGRLLSKQVIDRMLAVRKRAVSRR